MNRALGRRSGRWARLYCCSSDFVLLLQTYGDAVCKSGGLYSLRMLSQTQTEAKHSVACGSECHDQNMLELLQSPAIKPTIAICHTSGP